MKKNIAYLNTVWLTGLENKYDSLAKKYMLVKEWDWSGEDLRSGRVTGLELSIIFGGSQSG